MMTSQTDNTSSDQDALRREVEMLLQGLTARQLLFLRKIILSFPK